MRKRTIVILGTTWGLAASAAGGLFYLSRSAGMAESQQALQAALPPLVALLVTARVLSSRERQLETPPRHTAGPEGATGLSARGRGAAAAHLGARMDHDPRPAGLELAPLWGSPTVH
jgi:hypothetical protein